MLRSKKGRMSLSLIAFQMILVIQSPSSSATGFQTLILGKLMNVCFCLIILYKAEFFKPQFNDNYKIINRIRMAYNIIYRLINFIKYINFEQTKMTSPLMKKKVGHKKWELLLKHQEQIVQQKNFKLGQTNIAKLDNCKSRVVNFFGDVHSEVFALKVSPDDKYVGAACSNGQVRIYNLFQGKILNIGNTSRLSGYPCTGFRWKPKHTDQFVTCNCDGTIKWYSRQNQTAYGHYQKQQQVGYLCCDYQVNQEWCAFGTQANQIEIFDNQKMKPTHTYIAGSVDQLSSNHHNNRIFSIKCIKQDPNLFFSGGWDSTVQVWDIRVKQQSVRKFFGPSVSADSLDFKKGVILAGNYQNTNIVQLWDFKSGSLIQTLDIKQPENSNSYCFGASFAHKSQKDLIAVALTGSNKVKVLKDKKVSTQIQFQAAPLALDFYRYNDKDFLVVGGIQGTIYAIKLKWS